MPRLPPPDCRHDKQLVSHDEHTATYNYKFTFSVEVAPLCKVRAVAVLVESLRLLGLLLGGSKTGWLQLLQAQLPMAACANAV